MTGKQAKASQQRLSRSGPDAGFAYCCMSHLCVVCKPICKRRCLCRPPSPHDSAQTDNSEIRFSTVSKSDRQLDPTTEALYRLLLHRPPSHHLSHLAGYCQLVPSVLAACTLLGEFPSERTARQQVSTSVADYRSFTWLVKATHIVAALLQLRASEQRWSLSSQIAPPKRNKLSLESSPPSSCSTFCAQQPTRSRPTLHLVLFHPPRRRLLPLPP